MCLDPDYVQPPTKEWTLVGETSRLYFKSIRTLAQRYVNMRVKRKRELF